MMDFNIVPMEERHVLQVAELEKICFSDPWSESSVDGELKNPLSRWLVAEREGQVLGYVGSQTAAGESDIMNIAVRPDCRKMGVAKALLLRLMENLRSAGSEALTLEVRASNFAAIALYEKMGFSTVGLRPNYYFHPREDAKIMRKELMQHENTGH